VVNDLIVRMAEKDAFTVLTGLAAIRLLFP
jgi:hypothetical protein